MLSFLSVKSNLKRMGVVYRLHADLKAYGTKRRYLAAVEYYRKRTTKGAFDELMEQRAGDRLAGIRRNQGPLNLFYLGTDELQDRSGILQALERLGNLSFFTKANGEYGQKPPIGRPYESERRANSMRLLAMFEKLETEGRVPDVLFGQMWASLINKEALGFIRKRYHTLVVNICMDDRHAYQLNEDSGTHALVPYIHLAATAAPECVEWYSKEGCPALFFPEASDPDLFYPLPDLPKEHDVCFVGGRYGIRENVVRALTNEGVKVAAYGDGWENGPIATRDLSRLFAQSKIVLGVGTIGYCKDFYALKMRDFDAPMSGSFYLTSANQDLQLVYRLGEEIEAYHSIKDCVMKAKYFLKHEAERECFARRGMLRALRDHNWESRFRDLLGRMNLLTSVRDEGACAKTS